MKSSTTRTATQSSEALGKALCQSGWQEQGPRALRGRLGGFITTVATEQRLLWDAGNPCVRPQVSASGTRPPEYEQQTVMVQLTLPLFWSAWHLIYDSGFCQRIMNAAIIFWCAPCARGFDFPQMSDGFSTLLTSHSVPPASASDGIGGDGGYGIMLWTHPSFLRAGSCILFIKFKIVPWGTNSRVMGGWRRCCILHV